MQSPMRTAGHFSMFFGLAAAALGESLFGTAPATESPQNTSLLPLNIPTQWATPEPQGTVPAGYQAFGMQALASGGPTYAPNQHTHNDPNAVDTAVSSAVPLAAFPGQVPSLSHGSSKHALQPWGTTFQANELDASTIGSIASYDAAHSHVHGQGMGMPQNTGFSYYGNSANNYPQHVHSSSYGFTMPERRSSNRVAGYSDWTYTSPGVWPSN